MLIKGANNRIILYNNNYNNNCNTMNLVFTTTLVALLLALPSTGECESSLFRRTLHLIDQQAHIRFLLRYRFSHRRKEGCRVDLRLLSRKR